VKMTRGAVFVALLSVVVLLIAWVGRVGEGKRALADCDSARTRGDWPEAIMSARAAAEARCPAFCVSELGFARLYAIAKDAENRADDATSFAAWRAVRAASLAIAVLDVHAAKRERADQELARIGRRMDAAAAAAGAPASPAASEERLKATLGASNPASGTTYLLLAIGGLLFLGGAARFVTAKNRFPRADLFLSLTGAAVAACGALLF
jgi:hypothetical protein